MDSTLPYMARKMRSKRVRVSLIEMMWIRMMEERIITNYKEIAHEIAHKVYNYMIINV